MEATRRGKETMVRHAFGLLLGLRERDDAHVLLTQAIAFLDLLARGNDAHHTPLMLSVRVMQVGKSCGFRGGSSSGQWAVGSST